MAVLAGTAMAVVPELPSFFFQTSFFLMFTTVIVYVYLQRASNPEDFVRLYLGMIVLKLIVSLGYAVVMATQDPGGAKGNVLYFLLVYVVLTGIEVGFLYKNRR
jgi:hypothetical protein